MFVWIVSRLGSLGSLGSLGWPVVDPWYSSGSCAQPLPPGGPDHLGRRRRPLCMPQSALCFLLCGPSPCELWHWLLFYLSGHLCRRAPVASDFLVEIFSPLQSWNCCISLRSVSASAVYSVYNERSSAKAWWFRSGAFLTLWLLCLPHQPAPASSRWST